jgi:hypothetical protein
MQVGSSTSNPQGGTFGAPLLDGSFSFINMVNYSKLKEEKVYFSTRSHDYSYLELTTKGKETYDPYGILHIDKPENEMMMHILKGVYKRASHNPNARVAPNYSIVEYLSQMSCVMSTLEVLRSCPMQHTTLLSMIRETDSSNLFTMKFDATNVKPHLPYHVSFQIDVIYENRVKRTFVDEGASKCVMYLSCWKAIDSLEFAPSRTLLTTFGGRSFRPHKIISSFSVQLGGKSIFVEVEVVNAPLDYNLLL